MALFAVETISTTGILFAALLTSFVACVTDTKITSAAPATPGSRINTETESLTIATTLMNNYLDTITTPLAENVTSLATSPTDDVTSSDIVSFTDTILTTPAKSIAQQTVSFPASENGSAYYKMMMDHFKRTPNKADVWRTLSGDNLDINSLEQSIIIEPAAMLGACLVVCFPGIFGNIVLLFLTFSKELRNYSYSMFLAAIAVSDSLGLVFVYATMLLRIYGQPFEMLSHSIEMCRFLGILPHVFTAFSPWLLVAFSIDRFVAMVYPLKRKSFCTVRNARIQCAAVVVVVTLMHAPLTMAFTLLRMGGQQICYLPEGGGGFSVFFFLTVVFNSFVPVFLLVLFNLKSLLAIKNALRERKAMAPGGEATTEEAREDLERRTREAAVEAETRRATRALLAVPVFAFLSMTPFNLGKGAVVMAVNASLASYFTDWWQKAELYLTILYSFGYAGNFWLLLITSKSYRKITKKMLSFSRP